MITIQNRRLEVQIQEPGGGYQRSRFDWNGICQQITLDNSHTFCSREATKDDPGTEGVGLSDEFGINTPVGYDEAQVGDLFPKIGVGFLQRTDSQAYTFMEDYPIDSVKIQVEQKHESEVSFLQNSKNHNGWAWKLQKTFSLAGPMLTISYALENTGEKTIQTETYNHNFLMIDGKTVGPDYQLQLPFDLQLEQGLGPIATNQNTISLSEVPQKYFYALQGHCNPKLDVEWQIVHQPSGRGLRVMECFTLSKFALWGMSHVISPEFFLWIDLQPGQTQIWQREYTFF
jgi:hypothetical protein